MTSAASAELGRWIVAQRPARNAVDPFRPYAFFIEEELAEGGEIVAIATVFLTNRECPWRCMMCDLWQNTLTESVPPGAIPAQLDYALSRLPPARQIKLYNSGSFFDPLAIPRSDYEAIAVRLHGFERVIVESHPSLINTDTGRFQKLLDARLEVAMGLETVHPEILPRLNKRMTVDQFARAAAMLRESGAAMRAFILIQPPFLDEAGALLWAGRSIEFAFDCQATAVSLIPTRPGNGALEALAARGEFSPPRLVTLEAAAAHGITLQRGRVFADLWDLERFADCPHCFPARGRRLLEMNLRQTIPAAIRCEHCRAGI